jgi:plastocyanin
MRRFDFGNFALAATLAALMACGGGGSTGPETGTPPPGGTNGGTSGGTSGGTNGGTTGGTTGGATGNSVTVGRAAFSPASVTVAVNGTVTWKWDSCSDDAYYGQTCVAHSVTFDDASVTGSELIESGTFAKTFATAGTYKYHCAVHGTSMTGTVVVQ